MKKYLILLISVIGFASIVNAQTLRQYKKEALKAYILEDYYTALHHYQIIIDVDSSNIDDFYKHAESARKFDAYTLAESSYERVANSPEKSNYPELDYWLATTKKKLGKYEQSSFIFKRFIENSDSENKLAQEAATQLEYLQWAKTVVDDTSEDKPLKRLSSAVNTGFSEVSPLEVDGDLYYASLRFTDKNDKQNPPRLFSKVLVSKDGQTGDVVSPNFNLEGKHNSNASINHDQTRMYYTICDYANNANIPCQIYSRTKMDNGNWGAPVRLPDHINMAGTTSTQPNISFDPRTQKETLYFVSDRPLGKGGRDIWYSTLEADNTLSIPVNLEAINTDRDDITPFYNGNTKTLYFSSEGYKNLGGFDIFQTVKDGDSWGTVTNMGIPVNSSYNDVYYSINNLETKAYFASNRLGSAFIEEAKEACCNDIYEVDLEPIKINIIANTFHDVTKDPLNGVTVRLIEVEKEIAKDKHDNDNQYTFEAERLKEYVLIASKPNFASDTISVSTMNIRESGDIEVDLFLKPLAVDLMVLTFDEDTQEPLSGAKVILFDCDGNYIADLTNTTSNDFLFDQVNPNNCYELNISRPDYIPKTVKVTIEDILEPTRITEKVFLKKIEFEPYLPLPLYFDNDEPDKKTNRVTTSKTYLQTTDAYLKRIPTFKKEYSKNLPIEQKIQAEQDIEQFFNNEVILGIETFKGFDDHLIAYIQQGNTAELVIQGYASPLASNSYNDNLTKRRIDSIINHFRKAQGGLIAEFIAQGKIKIKQVPYGEVKAEQGISDNPNDRKNSIYSPRASKERRVVILAINTDRL